MKPDETKSTDSIIAELLAQRLEGEIPDLEGVLAAYPERAEEIRARYSDLEKLEALWKQMATGHKNDRAAEPFAEGTCLGEFEIIREIGHGGMGVVYLARQRSLDRMVALKVISGSSALSEATRKRFLRESEALASLAHPNIVPVFAAGEDKGALYIAMGLVDGLSLADVHGSWLNVAECELSVLSRHCLRSRNPDVRTLRRKVTAWQRDRNQRQCGVDWHFTTDDARIKLKSLYPQVQMS